MLTLLGAILASVMSIATASAARYWDNYPFLGVPPGGVRSPCTGLNLLANHGVIPNSGLNVTFIPIYNAMIHGFNFGEDAASTFALDGISRFGKLRTPNSKVLSFDLNDTLVHNAGAARTYALEHDASVTRKDAYFSPHQDVPDPERIKLLFKHSSDGKSLNLLELSAFLKERRNESFSMNPTTPDTYDLESAYVFTPSLILDVLGGKGTSTISLSDAASFLINERVPGR
ncbi:hypothetical protein HDU76_002971 [Blyttiomyces sp. JEL0837]|nr:hypothetical protein HDU76_002971 [Blyttiomyces sp. JEL0837]